MTKEGDDDAFVVRPGWLAEVTPRGDTRIAVSVPVADLPRVHAAVLGAMSPPLGFLYRQKVDRAKPKPQGSPPRDFVALNLPLDRVLEALAASAALVYGDARCEVWIRGGLGEQVVLDEDGMLFCYPDDPSFREALGRAGVPDEDVDTLSDRDYVKHWFHAEADPLETELLKRLKLVEVAARG